jgi:OmpA-OmpF porin, OOP family
MIYQQTSFRFIVGLLAIALSLQSCITVSMPTGGGGSSYPRPQYPTSTPSTPSAPIDRGITLQRVELTDQYTVLYMTVVNNNRPRYNQNGQMVNDGAETVGFHRSAELIAMQGARHFRFVRAEGIPVVQSASDPNNYRLQVGQRLNFAVYFERLDRGIDDFDLFECHDGDTYVCWNLYDIKVNNPLPPVAQAPAPQPTPTPTQKTPTKLPPVSGKEQAPPTVPNKFPTKPSSNDPTPVPTPPQSTVAKGVMLSGTVRDAKSNQPITAKLVFKQSPSLIDIDSVQSFQESGLYHIKLEANRVYGFVATARGYLVSNDVLDFTKVADGQTVKKDILLKPFEVGDKITLKNIYFEMGKADILDASFAALNDLSKFMKEHPTMQIRLEGHTDVVGDPDANLELSQQRVNNVKIYLINKGIVANRIEAVGYGSKFPIKKKGTEEERSVNRRVEFVILKL